MTKLEEVASVVLAEAYKTHGVALNVGIAKTIARAVVEALRDPPASVLKRGAAMFQDTIQAAGHPKRVENGGSYSAFELSALEPWNSMIDAILNEPTKE
jgi:hypothetical protein